MRGNDQKYVPDPRARSPGLNQFSGVMPDYSNSNPTYVTSERMTFSSPDYGRLNSGGGIGFPSNSALTSNLYERDFKQPSAYAPPVPQQYPSHDFKSSFDPNSMFVPQSKYLQEEMKRNNFVKDFNYAPPSMSKPMQMNSNFQSMSIPQPQPYETKPELQKYAE
jgi:hypothetical protein